MLVENLYHGFLNISRTSTSMHAHLHESPFFLCSEPGHVHPRCRFSFPQIVSLLLDCSEGYPAQPDTVVSFPSCKAVIINALPVELQDHLIPFSIGDDVYIFIKVR